MANEKKNKNNTEKNRGKLRLCKHMGNNIILCDVVGVCGIIELVKGEISVAE